MLFWQFANDIVPVAQAKRFYPLFGQMSSLAPVVAGLCVVRFTSAVSSGGKGKAVTEGLLDFVLVRRTPRPVTAPCFEMGSSVLLSSRPSLRRLPACRLALLFLESVSAGCALWFESAVSC